MLTSIKAVKAIPDVLRKFDRTANDLYSKAVFKVGQPIEALFSWLIQKTDIKKPVRSDLPKGWIFMYMEDWPPLF